MKKILLILMLAIAMSTSAQTFDEAQLVGTWKSIDISGPLPLGIKSFSSIILGDTIRDVNEWDPNGIPCSGLITDFDCISYDGVGDEYVLDFFISNNNKLHILIGDDFALRFVIEELTDHSLKMKTYDGKCSIKFSKDTASKARAISATPVTANTAAYNLNGQKVEDIQKKDIYIQNGIKRMITK